jgi:hypothetical protein
MREDETKKLKVGDRVQFRDDMPNDDNGSFGTVTDRDYARFMVKWDDGLECGYPHVLAMAIHRAKK